MQEKKLVEPPEPVDSLEPQQVKLLTGIRDYLDAGNGYFFPIQGMVCLLETDDKVVAGHFRALLNSGFIKEAAFYPGAFDITEKGRKHLQSLMANQTTNQITNEPRRPTI